jgi:hypothetical protein
LKFLKLFKNFIISKIYENFALLWNFWKV